MIYNVLKSPINAIICVFFIAGGLFIASRPAEAFSITENFDSYDLGSVSGQGDWTGTGGEVSDDIVGTSGYKTLKFSTFNNLISTLSFSSSTDLVISFNLYADTFDNNNELFFNFYEVDSPFVLTTRLLNGSGSFNYEVGSNRTATSIICPNFPLDTWYNIEIEADETEARYSCDGGSWTDYTSEGYSGTGEFNAFSIGGGNYSNGIVVYMDDLEISGQGVICDDYETRETCAWGGCYWENIAFQEEYSYCREILPGDGPETLCKNSIFDCVYCNSSTTCLGIGCNWSNIKGCSYFPNECEFENLENCEDETECENASGTWNGDFCFDSAVKEDCSEMELLPKMVCQIKNFLASMFLPSRTKITEMKQTIDTINLKFPSNYLKATYSFFGDIRDGIEGSSGIPFKILGHEENISFSVLEKASSTIGGTASTFGSLMRLLSGFVLMIPFIVWTLNFLQRIFK